MYMQPCHSVSNRLPWTHGSSDITFMSRQEMSRWGLCLWHCRNHPSSGYSDKITRLPVLSRRANNVSELCICFRRTPPLSQGWPCLITTLLRTSAWTPFRLRTPSKATPSIKVLWCFGDTKTVCVVCLSQMETLSYGFDYIEILSKNIVNSGFIRVRSRCWSPHTDNQTVLIIFITTASSIGHITGLL